MDWQSFMQWAFQGVLAGCAVYGASTLRELAKSVELLNNQMATILERDSWHTRWLEQLDDKVKRLEEKQ